MRPWTLIALVGMACASLAACGGGEESSSRKARAASLEACVAKVGAPAKPPMFEDFEPALKKGGVQLSDALAPPNDDYWLAVDFPNEKRARAASKALAPIAAGGMFGPQEVLREGVSVAVLHPSDGPIGDLESDKADIKLLRRCTKGFDVVEAKAS